MSTIFVRNNLYIEIYGDGSFPKYYLTDSVNFRIYVAKYDFEGSENLSFFLSGDTIVFQKFSKPYFGKVNVLSNEYKFDLKKLVESRINEKPDAF